MKKTTKKLSCPFCGEDVTDLEPEARDVHATGWCLHREHLQRAGRLGGKANTPAQREHRRNKAFKSMMRKRQPNNPRWR